MFERFTDRARRSLVLAESEAGNLNHQFIGTEHILLGLVDEESSTAATLAGLGVTKAAVRNQITAALAALRASRADSAGPAS